MKPITKEEVEAVYNSWVCCSIEPSAKEYIRNQGSKDTKVYWVVVGYEIARARAEKGEEL